MSNHPDPIGARLIAAIIGDDLERNPLAMIQLVSVRDVARVHEDVAAAIVRPNKAESSFVLETNNDTLPFLFALYSFRFFQVLGRDARKAVNAAER